MEKTLIEPYHETFRIRSYEVDTDANATPANVANYLQETAGNHAHNLGLAVDALQEKKLTWVITRLKFKMSAYPTWREHIDVETWPSGYNQLAATRDFLITNKEGTIIGKASSWWMVIDLKRRRPAPIEPVVGHLQPPDRERAVMLDRKQPNLAPTENLGKANIVVRRSDCDINGHANNVRYIDWALESLKDSEFIGRNCKSLDVQFRAEVFASDELISKAMLTEVENVTRHVLTRKSDGTEVSTVLAYW